MRVFILIALFLSGCILTPWGVGIDVDKAPPEGATKNGLVVVLGNKAFAKASGLLTNVLQGEWPEGLVFDGEILLDGSSVGLGELRMEFLDLWVDLGVVDIKAAPTGLKTTIGITSPYASVKVWEGETELCATEFAFDATIESQLSLGQDKYGRVESNILQASALSLGDHYPVYGPCDFALGPVLFTAAITKVGEVVGYDLAAEIGPLMEETVPGALGLDLAMDFSFTVGSDPMGTGRGNGRILAASDQEASVWGFEDGKLVVPFAVALTAQRHPCVPEHPLPAAFQKPLPAVEEGVDTELLINADVAVRAFHVAWQTGLVCDDRLVSSMELPVELLRNYWPILESFGSEAGLSLRVWPGANPEIELSQLGNRAHMTLKTGGLRIEVMIETDGAWVRLATLIVETEITGPLLVSLDGSVRLDPASVDVVTIETANGLLRAPNFEAVELIVKKLAESMVTGRPLLQLPPVATESGVLGVELRAGYLSFRKPPARQDR